MSKIWILAKRELRTFFDSLLAYILLALFIGLTGFFTWIMLADVFSNGQASLFSFFQVAYLSLFFFIPAITMKMFAEERKTGTIELLLTKSVSDWQVVVGKFLAVFMLILIALALSIPYYISITYLGESVDHGEILSGYLGLILMSAAYVSVGIWTSSVTNNQMVAFLLAVAIGIPFHFIFHLLGSETSGITSEVLHYLSDLNHFGSMKRGVIDSKDVVYFISIAIGGMVLTEAELSKRHRA